MSAFSDIKVVLDGYALRFHRVGIVNCAYALAKGYRKRIATTNDFKILLGDDHISDSGIKEFISNTHAENIFTRNKTLFNKIVKMILYSKNSFNRNFFKLDSWLQKSTQGYDVFHCTDWFFYPSRKTKVNVITIYDLTTTLFPNFHTQINIEKELHKINVIGKYDLVSSISHSARNDLLNHSKINPEKVIVNYIDTDEIYNFQIYKPRDQIYKTYGIPNQFRYLLCVSTLEPRKNLQKTLESFAHFLKKNPSAPYVLVLVGGIGWKNDEFQQYIASSNITDRVIFTGFADNSDLPSLYYHADCFLYLSWYEGFGLPILEAMKSHCPVICSNRSSMPEVIGNTGILVSPHDLEEIVCAIERVLSDKTESQNMRLRAFERSKLFSWDRHLDTLFANYRVLLGRS